MLGFACQEFKHHAQGPGSYQKPLQPHGILDAGKVPHWARMALKGATRCLTNSFTTIGAVTSSSCNLANLFQTQIRRQSESFVCPHPELGEAGAQGVKSRGLNA